MTNNEFINLILCFQFPFLYFKLTVFQYDIQLGSLFLVFSSWCYMVSLNDRRKALIERGFQYCKVKKKKKKHLFKKRGFQILCSGTSPTSIPRECLVLLALFKVTEYIVGIGLLLRNSPIPFSKHNCHYLFYFLLLLTE